MADKQYIYVDPGRRTNAVKAAAGSLVLLYAAQIVLLLMKYKMFDDYAAGRIAQPQLAAAFHVDQAWLVPITTVVMILIFATVIAYLVWVYRAAANVLAMGADIDASAGFAVGMYFIPFYNLVMPPVIMSRIARASVAAGSWRQQEFWPIIAIWWALQICVSVASVVVTLAGDSANVQAVKRTLLLVAASSVLNAAYHATQIVLVHGVAKAQRAQHSIANVF